MSMFFVVLIVALEEEKKKNLFCCFLSVVLMAMTQCRSGFSRRNQTRRNQEKNKRQNPWLSLADDCDWLSADTSYQWGLHHVAIACHPDKLWHNVSSKDLGLNNDDDDDGGGEIDNNTETKHGNRRHTPTSQPSESGISSGGTTDEQRGARERRVKQRFS